MSKFSVAVRPQGRDSLSLYAQYKDRFRNNRKVGPLTIAPAEPHAPADLSPEPIFSGSQVEVNDILAGFAEAAWAMGWRPRGLSPTLAMVVQNFKIPPEQG